MPELQFTEAQREAVTHGCGPLLVLAGPGSGKTRVITERVRFLIESGTARPEQILVVTFSRAAAGEMEERFRQSFQEDPGQGRLKASPVFGTFHSFFFQLLRRAYGYSGEQVAGEEERKEIVLSLVKELRIEGEDQKTLVQNLMSEIALVKEERADLSHYYAASCGAEEFRQLFRGYEQAIGERKKIDYEDMLLMTYELLSERQDILSSVRKRFRWILVDEFQDINRLQYEIVRMIAAPDNNLTIVGDDDQSIYRFRGARPEIMLGFKKDYPDAAEVLLDQNFRSTPEIVRTAGRLIRFNRERFPKSIKAVRPSGKPVKTIVFREPADETLWIAKELRRRAAEGEAWNSMAVLYRTNLQPRLLVSRLMQENVPFLLKEQLPDLMEHWIAKDLLAYLGLAKGVPEAGSLLRIMNRPNRYIRRDAVREEGESLSGIRRYYERQRQFWMLDRIKDLETELRILRRLDVKEGIARIRNEIGYDAFLKEYAEKHEIDPEELFEVLDELEDSASPSGGRGAGERFETPDEWVRHMREIREALEQQRKRNRGRKEEKTDAVRLMTFHGAKGLEFKTVFLIDVNEMIVPHRKASLREEIEEERRMFYVAMTRAKDELTVCACRERFRRKAEESPFIKEYENDSAPRKK